MATMVRSPEEMAPERAEEAEGAEEALLRTLRPHFAAEGPPWVQVGGFAASLALTLVAFGLVLHRALPPGALLAAVLALAVGQAELQLGVFMHLRESRGPAWQVPFLLLAFAIAAGLIIASVWIMAFKWGVS
jgi:cytochrome aa3-600 menaquinol oxidase subunit 4